MSYTPCPLCGEPLMAYAGSACTNPACGNRARPDDPNPWGKTADGSMYRDSTPRSRKDRTKAQNLKRAFKGIA